MNYSSDWILLLVVGYNLGGYGLGGHGLGGHNLSQSNSWDYSLNVCCAGYFSNIKKQTRAHVSKTNIWIKPSRDALVYYY